MPRKPEIGAVQLYPDRPLRKSDKNGYQLKFYCPLKAKRIRKNCGTRDKREARRIQRECRERLLNGQYVASGGAITQEEEERTRRTTPQLPVQVAPDERTWDEAYEHFRNQRKRLLRRRSTQASDSRIEIAGRIFEARRANAGLPPGVTLRECATLESIEYLQDRLLDGAEGRYESRSAISVNSMTASVVSFLKFCYNHEWIDRVPPFTKISVDEVMRGRPVTTEEFERMLTAIPKVVGEGPAPSWRFTLRVLWESGFRVSDVMNFSWDDLRRIHPVWPRRQSDHATLIIPSTQKNGRNEEIPVLPGLKMLLEEVPEDQRTGFVVNPLPIEYEMKSQGKWFMPRPDDLEQLIADFSNLAIARACGVSEQTVRNWLERFALQRHGKIARYGQEVPDEVVERLKRRAQRQKHQARRPGRLTVDRVSRIIASIGEKANVVVRQADEERGQRIKYASAHDLRRSLAERLINAGVSAETLMVVMRHKDFATTRKFYGAKRAAQSAAAEIHQRLVVDVANSELVGGLMGGKEKAPHLTDEELSKLKALLNSL